MTSSRQPVTPEGSEPGYSESSSAIARTAGYEPLATALEAVEARLAECADNPFPMLAESAGHLLAAGGKRIRPALTLISADAYRENCTEAVEAAVAVEFVHLGSLHHDDVIDEAETRRGVPTVNARWSNTVAVLSGDFLLARASQIAAMLGAEVAHILATTIARLAEGELAELQQLHDTSTEIPQYYDAITGKTAVLMGCACKLGALVAGAPARSVQAAEEFGTELGLVFQIVDDVLDLVGDERFTGKKHGIDLVEGVYTLPTLLALQADDGRLEKCLADRPGEEAVDAAIEMIVERGGVAGAVDIAARHLARCDVLLDGFPPGYPREALSTLSRYVLSRVTDD